MNALHWRSYGGVRGPAPYFEWDESWDLCKSVDRYFAGEGGLSEQRDWMSQELLGDDFSCWSFLLENVYVTPSFRNPGYAIGGTLSHTDKALNVAAASFIAL